MLFQIGIQQFSSDHVKCISFRQNAVKITSQVSRFFEYPQKVEPVPTIPRFSVAGFAAATQVALLIQDAVAKSRTLVGLLVS